MEKEGVTFHVETKVTEVTPQPDALSVDLFREEHSSLGLVRPDTGRRRPSTERGPPPPRGRGAPRRRTRVPVRGSTTADPDPPYFCHWRRDGPTHAGPQGHLRSEGRRRSRGRTEDHLRCTGHSSGGVHHPEVAWVGETERGARTKERPIGVGRFPWAANGRALALGHDEGQNEADLSTPPPTGCSAEASWDRTLAI